MGAELIGSFHGTTHGLIQIFFLSHLNIALLFTFCQNNPSMPATRQNIDFYIRFSSLFCKWSCLQQILSAYQIHILKRDNSGLSIYSTFVKNLPTQILASHLYNIKNSVPHFAHPELLVLFNNHSGLNYTLGARKDASTSHNHMPTSQLHRPVGGLGSMDLATFHEALARQDSPYGYYNTGLPGLKENKSYYVLSECISSDHKYLDGTPLSHWGNCCWGSCCWEWELWTCDSAGAFPVSWTPWMIWPTVTHSATLKLREQIAIIKLKLSNLIAHRRIISCSAQELNNMERAFQCWKLPLILSGGRTENKGKETPNWNCPEASKCFRLKFTKHDVENGYVACISFGPQTLNMVVIVIVTGQNY